METHCNAGSFVIRLTLVLVVISYTCIAARVYHGEHLFTRAEMGQKTVADYERLLRAAYLSFPYNADTALRYARLLQTHGDGESLRHVLENSGSVRSHWQAWELMGTSWERHAFTDAGTLEDARRAASYYDRVIDVNPSHERGLERRGVLALRLGEWEAVDNIAHRLLALNANNTNATYLKARRAEGLGELENSREAYSRLSAMGSSNPDAIYSQPEIVKRLQSASESGRQ